MDVLKSFILKNLIWILVIGSLVVMTLSLWLKAYGETEFTTISVSSALVTLAAAMMSGGIFAATVKSYQFNELYKSSLEEIIYSEKFLGNIDDKLGIWSKITSSILSEKNSENLSSVFHKHFIDHLSSLEKGYYYEDARNQVTIQKLDQDILYFVSVFDMKIVPFSDKPLKMKVKYSEFREGKVSKDQITEFQQPLSKFEIISSINGVEFENEIRPEYHVKTSPAAMDRTRIEYIYEYTLNKSEPFHLRRTTQQTQDLSKDNAYHFALTKYSINGLSVRIIHGDDIRVQFTGVGNKHPFRTRGGIASGNIAMYTTQPIRPNSGYMITFQKQKTQEKDA